MMMSIFGAIEFRDSVGMGGLQMFWQFADAFYALTSPPYVRCTYSEFGKRGYSTTVWTVSKCVAQFGI